MRLENPHNSLFRTVAKAACLFWALAVLSVWPLPVVGQARGDARDFDPRSVATAEIRSVITGYFSSVVRKDAAAVKALWNADSTHLANHLKELESIFASPLEIELSRLEFVSVTTTESALIVRVIAKAEYVDRKTQSRTGVFDSPNRAIFIERNGEKLLVVRAVAFESYLSERIAEMNSDMERLALIDANTDVVSSALVHAITQKGIRLRSQNPASAISLLNLALELSERMGDDSHLKSILPNLGRAYQDINEFNRSLELFDRALKVIRKLSNQDLETRVLLSMGITYSFLGDYRKANELTARRLSFAEASDKKSDMLIALINMSGNYARLRDPYRELEMLSRAQEVLAQIAVNDPSITKSHPAAAVVSGIGDAYARLGDKHQALEYYGRGLKLNEEVGRVDGGLFQNIGNLYLSSNEFAKARESYERALRQFRVEGYKQGIAAALEGIGYTYAGEDNFTQALEYHSRSLHVLEEINRVHDRIRLNVANSQLKTGDLLRALKTAESIISRPRTDERDLGSIPANLLAGKASKAQGNEGAAAKFFETAAAIADRAKSRYTGYGLVQPDSHDLEVSAYHEMVQLRLEQGRAREAFAFAEKAKARALLAMLAEGRVDIYGAMSPEERALEQRLKEDLVATNVQIERALNRFGQNGARISELKDALRQKYAKLETFQIHMQRLHPELFVHRAQTESISFDQLPDLIPHRKTAILEMVVTPDKTFLFAISPDLYGKAVLDAVVIDVKQNVLAGQIEKLRTKLDAGDLDFRTLSRTLYDVLLKPVEKRLAGKANIIIVPDGILWDLPFQALMDADRKFLLEKTAVSYAPSLTALRQMVKRSKQRLTSANAELIAFGNPVIETLTKERIKRVFVGKQLEPLPEAERLVSGLGAIYGPKKSTVFTGKAAREETAKQELHKFRIVQFATHGILSNASPMYSSLILSRNENSGNEDGLLEAWELKDLNIKADLVVLSACETARGKLSNGEGIIGMTWAMFIAGAPTTVASQWKVESSSTTELMLEFHRQLLSGKVSKAEALRRAQLKLLKDPKYKHPSYWGGWVLVGDGN